MAGLAVFLAGVGIATYVVHKREHSRTQRLRASISDLRRERVAMRAQLAAAAKSEKAAASSAYSRGVRAGTRAATQAQLPAGSTYSSGYDDGVKAGYSALGGFARWIDGAWYLVKVSRTSDRSAPYQVATRSSMRSCLWTYITHDQIYTGSPAC